MSRHHLVALAVALASCTAAPPPIVEHAAWDAMGYAQAPLQVAQPVELDRVIDGDTVVVIVGKTDSADGKKLTVRLLGIDCPESHNNAKCRKEGAEGGETCAAQIPKGLAAAKEMRQRLAGAVLSLEESRGPDLYGRTLAYVRAASPAPGGTDVGLSLVQDGFCHEFVRYPHPRRAAYPAAAAAWKAGHP